MTGRFNVLSIVVPFYNEEAAVPSVVGNIVANLPLLKQAVPELQDVEVILVNDGSRDGSLELATKGIEGHPQCRIINHAVNQGYGAALQTGFANAAGAIIAFFDCDNTFKLENMVPMLREYFSGEWEMVAGCRFTDVSQMPLIRRIGNNLFGSIIYLLTYEHVRDPSTGIRVVDREVLTNRLYPLPNGLNFIIVMTTRAICEGVRTKELHVPYDERIGRSKLNVTKDGLMFMKSILGIVTLHNPFKMFFPGTIITALLALTLAAVPLLGGHADNALLPSKLHWAMAAIFFAETACLTYVIGIIATTANQLIFQKRAPKTMFSTWLVSPALTAQFGRIGMGLLVAAAAAFVTLMTGVVANHWVVFLLASGTGLMGLLLTMAHYLIAHLTKHAERMKAQRPEIQ